MQAILKSIRPRHIMNILNGIKDLELSTTAPKDWLDYFNKKTDKRPDPRPVLMYCTKLKSNTQRPVFVKNKLAFTEGDPLNSNNTRLCNGKVIGMFTLKQIYVQRMTTFSNAEQAFEMAKRACLTTDEFFAYQKDKTIYAWKIDDLVVFDKPKELWEFCGTKKYFIGRGNAVDPTPRYAVLHKAPQNWCYVEV